MCADTYSLIGAHLCPDDRFRVSLTAISKNIYLTHLQDRRHVLELWAAWLSKTPSPEPEPAIDPDEVDYGYPPSPTSDLNMPHNDYAYSRYDHYEYRDPDSPFSDPLAELYRQDDCYGC